MKRMSEMCVILAAVFMYYGCNDSEEETPRRSISTLPAPSSAPGPPRSYADLAPEDKAEVERIVGRIVEACRDYHETQLANGVPMRYWPTDLQVLVDGGLMSASELKWGRQPDDAEFSFVVAPECSYAPGSSREESARRAFILPWVQVYLCPELLDDGMVCAYVAVGGGVQWISTSQLEAWLREREEVSQQFRDLGQWTE